MVGCHVACFLLAVYIPLSYLVSTSVCSDYVVVCSEGENPSVFYYYRLVTCIYGSGVFFHVIYTHTHHTEHTSSRLYLAIPTLQSAYYGGCSEGRNRDHYRWSAKWLGASYL